MSYRSEIWRKKRALRKCPVCGNVLQTSADTLSDLLSMYYTKYHLEFKKRHPVWGIPCWYAVCPCKDGGIFAALGECSEMWAMITKRPVAEGRELRLPFTYTANHSSS